MFDAMASGLRRAWTLEIYGQLRYYMKVRTNFDKFAQNTSFKTVLRIVYAVSLSLASLPAQFIGVSSWQRLQDHITNLTFKSCEIER